MGLTFPTPKASDLPWTYLCLQDRDDRSEGGWPPEVDRIFKVGRFSRQVWTNPVKSSEVEYIGNWLFVLYIKEIILPSYIENIINNRPL